MLLWEQALKFACISGNFSVGENFQINEDELELVKSSFDEESQASR